MKTPAPATLFAPQPKPRVCALCSKLATVRDLCADCRATVETFEWPGMLTWAGWSR